MSDNLIGVTKIDILDISGRLIKSIYSESVAAEISRINISGMTEGMYLLSASNNGKTVTCKFLVE
ncbi:MAG: T9SS type A sorting domain-containing protein [Draconibacterium sp.]|nr:T9SS type A sorting domain-containing protein [Draconibacterium sp.]